MSMSILHGAAVTAVPLVQPIRFGRQPIILARSNDRCQVNVSDII
jgi:hypothetical protein